MVDIFKRAISAGGYKLTEIQHKIKKLYVMGDITEVQMDELLAMASRGVSVDAERPQNLQLIEMLAEEINALKDRVTALEGEDAGGDDTGYPIWRGWDGISKDYQKGAIVSHNGKLWQSIFDGQNVWEPSTIGTENLWVEYTA